MEYDDNDGTSQTDEISQEDSTFTAETRLQLRNPVNRRTHPFEVLWKKRGGPVCYLILICEMFVCDERQVRAIASMFGLPRRLFPPANTAKRLWWVSGNTRTDTINCHRAIGGFINKSVNVRRGIHGRNHRFLIHIRHDWMAFSYHSRQLCPFIPGSATDIFGYIQRNDPFSKELMADINQRVSLWQGTRSPEDRFGSITYNTA